MPKPQFAKLPKISRTYYIQGSVRRELCARVLGVACSVSALIGVEYLLIIQAAERISSLLLPASILRSIEEIVLRSITF